MTTITQKKKLSRGTWILLFVVIAAIIAIAVMAAIGYISLAFMADWLVGTMMFGTAGWINAVLVLATPFLLGLLLYYVAVKYFIGNKVTTAPQTYTPQGQTLSQPPQQSGNETVIS